MSNIELSLTHEMSVLLEHALRDYGKVLSKRVEDSGITYSDDAVENSVGRVKFLTRYVHSKNQHAGISK